MREADTSCGEDTYIRENGARKQGWTMLLNMLRMNLP